MKERVSRPTDRMHTLSLSLSYTHKYIFELRSWPPQHPSLSIPCHHPASSAPGPAPLENAPSLSLSLSTPAMERCALPQSPPRTNSTNNAYTLLAPAKRQGPRERGASNEFQSPTQTESHDSAVRLRLRLRLRLRRRTPPPPSLPFLLSPVNDSRIFAIHSTLQCNAVLQAWPRPPPPFGEAPPVFHGIRCHIHSSTPCFPFLPCSPLVTLLACLSRALLCCCSSLRLSSSCAFLIARPITARRWVSG